jgi:vancomycin resistance protein VanJ
LLWTQGVAALLLLFPLMGFVPPWPNGAGAGLTMRVLSFNVNSAHAGAQAIVAAILEQRPDVVVLVEAPLDATALSNALAPHYPHVQRATQFLLASRFPITQASELPRVRYLNRNRSSRAMRYLLEAPLGPLALYAVHPISPRGAFGIYRFRGLPSRLRHGEPVSADEESDMIGNVGLRSTQIEAAVRAARSEQVPVLIAGDTNLPGLSPALREAFSGFQDGFAAAGWGFGYTFPAKSPFLRLDRVFAGPELRFTHFQLGCPRVSDHLCVWADLTRR